MYSHAAPVPMRNSNKMKLGVFCFNASGGTSFTSFPEGRIVPTWDQNQRIARAADSAGWEFVLPIARWKGFGGATNHNHATFEVFSWASAVAASTEQIQVFSTAHVPLYHPLLAAKLAATIDQISNGRFGLNVVVGWNGAEMSMFGLDQRDHAQRYQVAAEWLGLIDQLWTEPEVFDFEGEFFSSTGAYLSPKPVQERPVIVNAGSSPDGMDFIAQHCDFGFQAFPNLERVAQMNKELRARADAHGREVGVVNTAYVVCADTEAEARRYHDHYVDELGDWEGGRALCDQLVGQSRSHPEEMLRSMTRSLVAGWGAVPLVGTPEQIADRIIEMHGLGTNGLALSWVDFEDGIGQFDEQVVPLLRNAGLRD